MSQSFDIRVHLTEKSLPERYVDDWQTAVAP